MKRHERLLGATLGLFCTVQLYTAPARAEDASAAETAAARSLAVEGLKLAQAGDCAAAVPKLERAEKLYHATVVASRLGECYVSLGRLVEGTEILRKVLREPQSADATPAATKALDRAQRALDAAKPRIAGLTVKVAAVQDITVKIDGTLVPSALVETEIPTDPGEHSIDVNAPGFLKSSTHIKVSDAEKKTVTLTLTRDPNALVAVVPAAEVAARQPGSSAATGLKPPAAEVPDRSVPAPTAANRTPAYVALGIGAAALATGGVLGVLTLKQHKALQDQCPNDVCPPDTQADLSSAKQLGNFSTIAFGVGGAGVVLGTVLLFTVGSSSADHAQAAPKSRFAGITRARVAVAPGQITLDGDF
jgi:hypothetical protein